jgi:H+/Cl- antiporter ClcA
MNSAFIFFVLIGIIFGALSFLFAYLITYNELIRHYPTKKEPKKMAKEIGIFAFIFFFGLSVLIGYLLIKF